MSEKKILNHTTETVPIDSLIPHERNPNEGDFGAIYESIDANGFYGTIIGQLSTRKIIAGNHRWSAAKKAGYEHVPVTWLDIDDVQAKKILLADNHTNRLGKDNEQALADLLKELAETDDLLGTSYSGDDLDDLLASLEPFNPNEHWTDTIEFENEAQKDYQQIVFHFETKEDVEKFKELTGLPIGERTKYMYYPYREKRDLKPYSYEQGDKQSGGVPVPKPEELEAQGIDPDAEFPPEYPDDEYQTTAFDTDKDE